MTSFLSRFRKAPLAFLRRAWSKLVVGRLRYGRGASGYDAQGYWSARLTKYSGSLRGPGHEGLSEAENLAMYRQAADIFRDVCRAEGVAFERAKVLEIGCGNGFYTRLCRSLGVTDYTGLDVTDVLFPALRGEFGSYTFHRMDITRGEIHGSFDLVLMIDVVEHIVDDAGLDRAMLNVKRCLVPGGLFILALPFRHRGCRPLFYLRYWSRLEIEARLDGLRLGPPIEFRDGTLLTIRAPSPSHTCTQAS